MAALEQFLHDEQTPYSPLTRAALAHLQFETIHPFLDGNGRIGRLLIALILYHDQVLSQPLLYLSLYLKKRRTEYYELLDSVRQTGRVGKGHDRLQEPLWGRRFALELESFFLRYGGERPGASLLRSVLRRN